MALLVVVAAWLVLALATWVFEYRAAANEHARLQAEIQAVFSSVIKDEPMVDPRVQLERDTLRDRVTVAGGINATIESASSEGDAVEGRLQLRTAQ